MPLLSPLLAYAVTILAGASVAMQQAVNARLRGEIGSPWWAGFISYFVGMVVMLLVALAVEGARSPASILGRINGFSWTGGMFGAIFIGIAILMVPRLGAATTVGLIVVGQLLASVAFDHLGILGMSRHPIDLMRLTGVTMLIAGVMLIRR